MLRQTISDVIKNDRQHFIDANKCDIQIVLVPECSHCHFFDFNVLISEYFFGVVVCDKSSLHSADFDLHDIFEKTSPNQIVVLSLETLMHTSFSIYFVV